MRRRLVYVDVINCMAIFFVLMLHSSQLAHATTANIPVVKETRIIQFLCIPAVYLFFMNSGATILNYRERYSTVEFFKHRILRALVPFLVWSVLYYLYDLKWKAYPGPIPQSDPSVSHFLQAFFSNHINNTFWFFYVIVGLYVATPVLSLLSKKIMIIIVGVLFFINDLLPYFLNLAGLSVPSFSIFLGWFQYVADTEYFLMGYLIKEELLDKRIEYILIILGGITCFGSVISAWTFDRYIIFTGLSPFLYSISLYLIIKKSCENISNRKLQKVFSLFSGGSLGLYILHPIFYSWYISIMHVNWMRQLYIIGMPVVVYILGVSLIIMLKKIKPIRVILP